MTTPSSTGRTAGSGPGTSIVRCPHCAKANRIRPVPRGVPRCGACHRPLPWLVAAGPATVDQELTASVPVLVDLWAPWCGPCRAVTPVLERLARDRAGHLKILKINVDEATAAANRFRAYSIPLLVLLRDGRELGRLTGARPLPQLVSWLDDTLAGADRP